MTWELKVDFPKSQWPRTLLIDQETGLLSRITDRYVTVTYSDYRDVGGTKQAFSLVQESSSVRTIVTVREAQINVPIDDARFAEPQVKNGMLPLNPVLPPQASESRTAATVASKAPEPAAAAPASPTAPAIQINYPNFATCTLAELQTLIPELRQLKAAGDQNKLPPLLDRIGAKLLEIARNTPNLISHEVVTDSARGVADKKQEYDYLILNRRNGTEIFLNEFRVDLKTGEQFQMEDVKAGAADAAQAVPAAANSAAHQPAGSENSQHPVSQGFASSWVYFFPQNQAQSAFRYLGEQQVQGRHSVVLAFAQNPQAVQTPGLFRYQGRSVAMYFQGVAWFDPSDFRLLRMRTELLAPLVDFSLQRLSADIEFAETRIPDLSSILFLPRDVEVTSVVGGGTLREHHNYSNYRLFRAASRIVLNP